jgi:hypothetical protein
VLARASERSERVRLAARAVERGHQLPVPPLAGRCRGDQRLELGLDAFLFGLEPQLLETCDLRLCEVVVRDVGICRAAPQREGVRGARGGAHRLGLARSSSSCSNRTESTAPGSTSST